MADNTILNSGSGGDTVATDDISGVKFPRGKITLGADGVNDGDVSSANPMPVSDAGGTLTVDAPVGTPVFVRLSDGAAAITTLPVSLASVPSHAVTNAGTFAVQAAQSGTWTLTDISGTITLPTGAATAAKQPALGVAGTASADVITVQGIASMTALKVDGSAVTQPVSGTVTANAGTGTFTISGAVTQSGTWNIGTVTTVTGVTTVSTVTSLSQFAGNAINLGTGTTGTGTLRVVLATDQPQLTNKLLVTPDAGATVQPIPATSGGLSIYRNFQTSGAVIAAAIKASAGQVYGIEVTNINATPVYVRFYNQTGSPGTSDTVVWSAIVPGNTAGAGIVRTWDKGMAFGTGIGIRVTNAIADNDNTALTANTVMVNVQYK